MREKRAPTVLEESKRRPKLQERISISRLGPVVLVGLMIDIPILRRNLRIGQI
jgi:hypothetical protein